MIKSAQVTWTDDKRCSDKLEVPFGGTSPKGAVTDVLLSQAVGRVQVSVISQIRSKQVVCDLIKGGAGGCIKGILPGWTI